MSRSKWITVDMDGLQALAARRPAGWWLHELIQNSLDEPGVTEVNVTLSTIAKRHDVIKVEVVDDAPAGWLDLNEARVMFAPSKKASDPELRGRFNLGEKLFLSVCESAWIRSMGGSVQFQKSGRVNFLTFPNTEKGTMVGATVLIPPALIGELVQSASLIIPPEGVKLAINGDVLPVRTKLGTAEGPLPTEFDGGDGHIRRTVRKTTVDVYRPELGEQPHIFEMGIPICEHKGEHHLNVNQVVPLSLERLSVTPRYLEQVYGLALDALADELDQEEASATWVTQGMADAQPESVASAVSARFGQGAVAFNPAAPESNAEALEAGRTVIPPRALPKAAWDAVRRARETVAPDLAQPSSQAFPVGVRHKAGGQPPIEHEKWTMQMDRVAEYARRMARHCLPTHPRPAIFFYDVANGYSAWWKRDDAMPELSINVGVVSVLQAVSILDQDTIDELLVHEMAHQLESNHLSHGFHDALCKIAVRLRTFREEL